LHKISQAKVEKKEERGRERKRGENKIRKK